MSFRFAFGMSLGMSLGMSFGTSLCFALGEGVEKQETDFAAEVAAAAGQA